MATAIFMNRLRVIIYNRATSNVASRTNIKIALVVQIIFTKFKLATLAIICLAPLGELFYAKKIIGPLEKQVDLKKLQNINFYFIENVGF